MAFVLFGNTTNQAGLSLPVRLPFLMEHLMQGG